MAGVLAGLVVGAIGAVVALVLVCHLAVGALLASSGVIVVDLERLARETFLAAGVVIRI